MIRSDSVRTDITAAKVQVLVTKDSWISDVLKRFYIWRMFKHAILISILIMYMCLGGAIFFLIEAPMEMEENARQGNQSVHRQAQFVERLMDLWLQGNDTCSCHNFSEICRTCILDLIENYDQVNQELGACWWKHNETEPLWTYSNAMFYAASVFTTIGYGNIYCKSKLGQAMTIVYAMIGIPLILTVLKDLGKMVFCTCCGLWHKVCVFVRSRGKNSIFHKLLRRRTLEISSECEAVDELEWLRRENELEEVFPLPLAVTIIVLFSLLSAAVYCAAEPHWDFFTSFYFFFITVSTIGFGDLVPQNNISVSIFSFVLVITGLSLVSFLMNIMQTRVEKTYSDAIINLEEFLDLREETGLPTKNAHKGSDSDSTVLGAFQIRRLGSLAPTHWRHSRDDVFLSHPLPPDSVHSELHDEPEQLNHLQNQVQHSPLDRHMPSVKVKVRCSIARRKSRAPKNMSQHKPALSSMASSDGNASDAFDSLLNVAVASKTPVGHRSSLSPRRLQADTSPVAKDARKANTLSVSFADLDGVDEMKEAN